MGPLNYAPTGLILPLNKLLSILLTTHFLAPSALYSPLDADRPELFSGRGAGQLGLLQPFYAKCLRQYAAARSTSAVSEQEATVKRLEQSPARRVRQY